MAQSDPLTDFAAALDAGGFGAPDTDLYDSAAKANGLDPRLLHALSIVESGERDNAKSSAGALGRTQIMPQNFAAYGVTDPTDPNQTVPATAKMLAGYLKGNGQDIEDALRQYHGGPDQSKWGPLTQAYPQKVLAQYAKLAGQEYPDSPFGDEIGDQLTALGAPPKSAATAPAVPVPKAKPAASVEQYTGPGRTALQVGSRALQGATSLVGLPGTIGDLLDTGFEAGRVALGGTPLTPEQRNLLRSPLSTNAIQAPLRAVGAIDNPRIAPQGFAENALGAAVQGAASAPFGPAAMVAGAGGGLGARGAEEVFPDNPFMQFMGGLVGGVGAGKAGNLLERGANALQGAGNTVMSAAQRLGIQLRLPSTVTGRAPLSESAAAHAPFGLGPLAHAAQSEDAQVGQATSRLADRLGAATTPQELGQNVQARALNWVRNERPQVLDRLWAPVGTPQMAAADVSPLATAQANLRASGQKLPKALADQLDVVLQHPSWQNVKELRSWIGEMRGNPDVSQTISDAGLSALYKGASDSMRGAAQRAGVETAFDKANAESTKLYDFSDNVITKLIGSSNPLVAKGATPEQVGTTLLSGAKKGNTVLRQMEEHMPGVTSNVGALILRQSQEGAKSASSGVAKALGELSPEAYNTIFNRAGTDIHDLGTVAKAVAPGVEKYTTPPSGFERGLHIAEGLLGPGLATLGLTHGAGTEALGLAAAPLMVGPAAGRIATNPLLLNLRGAAQSAPPRAWPNALLGIQGGR